ncbi:galactose-1-phosphate uridylyltransferase [Hyphomonas sp.]|uniref:galactose-1-phosphate uridylyltransferase n=1 Tax=Hyphomonas sp. TaxID=87 RepID=UPI00391C2EE1
MFRRDHLKADGRRLALYGYAPHDGPVLDELLRPETAPGELRRDPLRNSWAIYAPHRQSRTFLPSAADDPLAPARQGGPLTEIPFEDFELAVFENRFPSLASSGAAGPLSAWASGPAQGQCDVVVFSKEPAGSLGTLTHARRVLLIEALIDRYRSLHAAGFAYVMPFENRGEQVGVTLPHPHGQIYAFGDIPAPQLSAAKAFEAGFDLIAEHASWDGAFDVTSDGDLTAFCPPFARFPYETWIMPGKPCAGPWEMDSDSIHALARLLGEIPRRLDALFAEPMPYMMSFQAAPRGMTEKFQFTVQFFPILRSAGRLKFLASVEQFTGVFTVDVVPEAAAGRLRLL